MDLSISISALQHFSYCPRQFALIHLENAWSDNCFTAQGAVLHQRADSKEANSRGPKRSERSVEVQSSKLGIHGKLDLLEIFSDEGGMPRYVPVEYKRGRRKVMDWDRIQLCAQGLCLEEMLGVTVRCGALWYWQERLREPVTFDNRLRSETAVCIEAARFALESKITPPPTDNKNLCKACSLVNLCIPDVARVDRSTKYVSLLFKVTP